MVIDLILDEPARKDEMLEKFGDFQRKAEMYYAFQVIYKQVVSINYIVQIFTLQL